MGSGVELATCVRPIMGTVSRRSIIAKGPIFKWFPKNSHARILSTRFSTSLLLEWYEPYAKQMMDMAITHGVPHFVLLSLDHDHLNPTIGDYSQGRWVAILRSDMRAYALIQFVAHIHLSSF